ncbi:MAG: DUF3231 family protein [Bacillota bacterium]|nr:DUF3231 family protein [Bacillota bacterium]
MKHLSEVKKEITDLEGQLSKFAVGVPKPPRKDVRSAVETEILSDSYIASTLLLLYQELIEMKLRSFRTASTNDGVRKMFLKYTKKAINVYDNLLKYVKLRGWIDKPSLYPNLPANASEQLDTGEAFHLWDHLTFRYDNIELTQIFYELAQDGDFKLLLKKGIQDVLQKDAARLEKELTYFGIPFPHQPRVIYDNLGTVELSDSSMFKQVYLGMQSAAVIHAQAIKQSTTNDRIRKLFNELLLAEIGTIDKVIKFGKLKDWLQHPPQYGAVK